MIQDTLVLIKPDCVRRKMIGSVITAIESLGLAINHLEKKTLTRQQAESLYKDHQGKWHFTRNIRHITSGDVIAIHVVGEDAISRCRNFVESYRTANQDVVKLPANLLHATSDPEKSIEELIAVGCVKNKDDSA